MKTNLERYADMMPTSDDVLDKLGLQRKTAPGMLLAEGLAVFGAGCLVGAGLALLFAPRPGRELRGDLAERAGHLKDKIATHMPSLPASGTAPVPPMTQAPSKATAQ